MFHDLRTLFLMGAPVAGAIAAYSLYRLVQVTIGAFR